MKTNLLKTYGKQQSTKTHTGAFFGSFYESCLQSQNNFSRIYTLDLITLEI